MSSGETPEGQSMPDSPFSPFLGVSQFYLDLVSQRFIRDLGCSFRIIALDLLEYLHAILILCYIVSKF